ncbi:GA module-containing protein [Ureaplasma diversum]|uniref:Protein G-related albumin-binding (GA) module domain-containing protein n=1 Tax=Ureaplasma diversum NCTC 246 TaxID=1188241 RepID=A0A084EZW1_9BACT|nr:GA module-containing protein [Ureaplasma diversum]KEZ23503.1 hypothetical protein UDIV_2740 [Ureaplasma diversum NCTC 246]
MNPEPGATPDNAGKKEEGDQGSNNVDSEADKKKKEQEAEEAKKKEAEAAFKTKKEQANATISGLTNLSDEERNGYKDRVEKIADTNKITEIEDIVKEAQAKDDEKMKSKEAADKLEEAKQKAINEIKNLQALEENERTTFVQKIEAIKTVEQKDEVEKILKEAKDANTKKLQEEAKKQADEIKQDQITSAKLTIGNDKYFWLELTASKETYDKLKDKRLMFNLDKIGGNEGIEFATRFKVGENAFTFHKFIKNEGSNVIFQISSDQAYGAENEKGKYRVTKIWLENDVTETNLLKTPSNEVDNL